MKSSQRIYVKVAVIQRDEVVQRLRSFVVIAFAVVATVLLAQLRIAAVPGLAF